MSVGWIIVLILMCSVSIVPLLYIGGRAVYESAKVSSWASIFGALVVFGLLVWIASLGPTSEP